MARVALVRHGRATAGWDADADPGLDAVGRAQAEHAAADLAWLQPAGLVTSPLRRARETAASFEDLWGSPARLEPRVGEIVSPTADLRERGRWLAHVMEGYWADLPEKVGRWRQSVIDAVTAIGSNGREAVVVTHFVAINAIVGAATGDDRVLVCNPGHGASTILEITATGLAVIESSALSSGPAGLEVM